MINIGMKHYISKVEVRNGDYETLTNYCFQAENEDSAEEEVIEAFDIGGDNSEQQAELCSLTEVTEEEYKVLVKYV